LVYSERISDPFDFTSRDVWTCTDAPAVCDIWVQFGPIGLSESPVRTSRSVELVESSVAGSSLYRVLDSESFADHPRQKDALDGAKFGSTQPSSVLVDSVSQTDEGLLSRLISSFSKEVQVYLPSIYTIDAAQHVLLEAQPGSIQTAPDSKIFLDEVLSSQSVSIDVAPRMIDVSVNYLCDRSVPVDASLIGEFALHYPILIDSCSASYHVPPSCGYVHVDAEVQATGTPHFSILCSASSHKLLSSTQRRCTQCGYLPTNEEDERETDFLPEGTLDDELLDGSNMTGRDEPVGIQTRSVHWQPPVFKKTCATQFAFTPDLADVFCQTAVNYSDASVLTSDICLSPTVLLHNKSVTDYRERLIEHYYYAPPRDAALVADVEVQALVMEPTDQSFISRWKEISETEIIELKETIKKSYDLKAYEMEMSQGRIEERSCTTDFTSPPLITPQREVTTASAIPAPQLPGVIGLKKQSKDSFDVGIQCSTRLSFREIKEEFSMTEIWESLKKVCSTYESYQTLHDSGYVREQSTYTTLDDTMVADMGVQFTATTGVFEREMESLILRTPSPVSNVDPYEQYVLRKRMGQLNEEQCLAAPLVYSDGTQTEDLQLHFSTDFDGFGQREETFEVYHHRLLRDQLAEAWTQWDTDAEEEIGDVEGRSRSEEQILEVRQKKRKRVVSKLQITEELSSDEPGMMVCELGVQTESSLVDRESQETVDRDIFSASYDKSLYLRATQSAQTSPISLDSVLHTEDWSWADSELQAVIMTGLQATDGLEWSSRTGQRRYEETVESSLRSVSQWKQYAEPSTKLLVSIGCQTGAIKPGVIDGGELDRWTDTSIYPDVAAQSKTAYSSVVDDEIFVRSVSTESSDASKQPSR
uniref:Polyprotein n=1 Tax=Echinostoma caproni TaxID=27848 RepID=A0A183A1C8_9TREM